MPAGLRELWNLSGSDIKANGYIDKKIGAYEMENGTSSGRHGIRNGL